MSDKGRFLSLILRHKPEKAKIVLDKNGWTTIQSILNNTNITLKELNDIVENNDKKRFEISEDNTKIRAVQGHSIKSVEDPGLEKAIPPPVLYHGTKKEFLKSIMKDGLQAMSRNHVHLSADKATAVNVAGRRKGESVILEIDSAFMRAENFKFYKSKNSVWLTYEVPPKYISVSK